MKIVSVKLSEILKDPKIRLDAKYWVDKKTLKLSHEEIAYIQQALGIAEKVFADKYKEVMELSNVRGNNLAFENDVKFIWELSCSFADINLKLMNGEFDI